MQRSRKGARRHRLDQKDIGAGGARRRLVLAAAGYADDRNARERRLKRANARDRLDAVDPRQDHVHQHRIECALRDPFRRGLTLADELGLVTEFGQDRVEHDTAERIVFDAQQPQRPQRIDRYKALGARRRRHGVRCG